MIRERDKPENDLEIEVTPEMIEAGLEELREHHYDTDIAYMVACVYRMMHYAKLRASSTNASR